MEKVLNVKLGPRSYPIIIGSNVLSSLGSRLKKINLRGRILIITNKKVGRLYLKSLIYSFNSTNYEYQVYYVAPGEKNKNLKTVEKIYNYLLKNKYDRQTIIVALGGGVIGDIAGFAAATYMRGVNYIQVPTTLLAQVDSAVGGKTGVNHPKGKNIIGAFYQPKLVLADVYSLLTLPRRELSSGLAEVIKYDLISSKKDYDFLQKKLKKGLYDKKGKLILDQESLINIVYHCCAIKAEIVATDEKEKNIRAILNFGHTFGHAIEAVTKYKKYTHGEAVALGMLCAVAFSVDRGYLNSLEYDLLKSLCQKVNLPAKLKFSVNIKKVQKLMYLDKKVTNAQLKIVLLKKIGSPVIETVTDDLLVYKSLKKIT